MSLSGQQLLAISVTERACSAVSLMGTAIIVTSFLYSSSFRKPINRLVFYASWGNMMTNVATLISQSGLNAGTHSFPCQLQAFLIQWFMPADALWIFSMACNVYLTFFHKYNSDQLRRLEWKYVLSCYGLPFIPSFAYFFVNTNERGRVYGAAILWCWVSQPWDFLRVAVFYGPVWFVIFTTFAIYARCGKLIYRKRKQLRAAASGIDSVIEMENPPVPSGSKVTETSVTSEIATRNVNEEPSSPGKHASIVLPKSIDSTYDPYSVSVEAGGPESPSVGVHDNPLELTRSGRQPSYLQCHMTATERNTAAYAYTKYAMLYFIALLVTWVPSTANRVYALAKPTTFSFGLNYASSFVLPLQGFWNSVIYVSVSWPAFKDLFYEIRVRNSRHPSPDLVVRRQSIGHTSSRRYLSVCNESSQELAV